MRNYREHLGVPILWWVLGLTTAATFAVISWAGFNLLTGVILFVVLVLGPAAALAIWGRSTIEVSSGELRAGRATLPLALAGTVQALDQKQTEQMRGPMADPAAFMWVRPYLRLAVYIEIAGEDAERPYWLIGTRHPAELAQAIDRSRPQFRAGDTSMA
jgi:Protein of unknown function (DUF3093)